MTNNDKQMLLNLGKSLISDLTKELNSELDKANINADQETKNDIIANCDGILAKINSRLNQIKSLLTIQ